MARVIERGAKGHVGTAVMADDGEAIVTESVHQLDTVGGLGALGRAGMIRRVRRFR